LKFPEKGIGIDRFQDRRQKMEDLLRQAQRTQESRELSDTDANLRKLRDLHEAGILTDEEFEAKKAQLQGHA
jgi:hypothetical protein